MDNPPFFLDNFSSVISAERARMVFQTWHMNEKAKT
jgi:hypothetical protein